MHWTDPGAEPGPLSPNRPLTWRVSLIFASIGWCRLRSGDQISEFGMQDRSRRAVNGSPDYSWFFRRYVFGLNESLIDFSFSWAFYLQPVCSYCAYIHTILRISLINTTSFRVQVLPFASSVLSDKFLGLQATEQLEAFLFKGFFLASTNCASETAFVSWSGLPWCDFCLLHAFC